MRDDGVPPLSYNLRGVSQPQVVASSLLRMKMRLTLLLCSLFIQIWSIDHVDSQGKLSGKIIFVHLLTRDINSNKIVTSKSVNEPVRVWNSRVRFVFEGGQRFERDRRMI